MLLVALEWLNQSKTLTFQNDVGWYQAKDFWNDSHESVAVLSGLTVEHSIDFDCFPMDGGISTITCMRRDALRISPRSAAHIPDLSALGYGAKVQ